MFPDEQTSSNQRRENKGFRDNVDNKYRLADVYRDLYFQAEKGNQAENVQKSLLSEPGQN